MAALPKKMVKISDVKAKVEILCSDIYDIVGGNDMPYSNTIGGIISDLGQINKFDNDFVFPNRKADFVELARIANIPNLLDGLFIECAKHEKARSHPEWAQIAQSLSKRAKDSGLTEDINQLLGQEIAEIQSGRGLSIAR